jgi:hypothetical protein
MKALAPLLGKMATLRKILVHPGEEPPGSACLPMRIKFLSSRTTAELHFRQVGKELELRVLQEEAARFQSVSAYLNTGQTN